jgi:putative Mg2+ transporter-C (MgtC) family protein
MMLIDEIVEAITAEFRDLSDVRTGATVCFRLVLAGILGGCLGYERESKGKAAGLRTHMLVSLGAAVFVMGPQLAGFEDAGLSRVIQGLIAGIGFLGAGAIVKGHPGEDVQGLTTAASIWMTAAIGVTAGMGRASTAVLSTALALLVLAVLCRGEGLLRHRGRMPKRMSDKQSPGGDDGRP